MNTIIVLASQSDVAETTFTGLVALGVAQAHPSRRESLSPTQVHHLMLKTLRQRGGSVYVGHAVLDHSLDKMWSELAVDLVLANVDHALWGWSQALDVHTPDFWKRFDPSIQFVLAYTSPVDHLMQVLAREATLTHGDLSAYVQASLDEWVAHHTPLLQAFYRLGSGASLVYATRGDDGGCLAVLLGLTAPDDDAEHIFEQPAAPSVDVLQRTLLQQVAAAHHSQAMTLWAELQAVAHVPLLQEENRSLDPLDLWHFLHLVQEELEAKVIKQQADQKQLAQLEGELQRTKAQQAKVAADLQAQIKASEERAEKANAELKAQARQTEQATKESELLLGQLHLVQEALEAKVIKQQADQKQLAQLEGELQRTKAQQAKVAADLQAQIKASEERAEKANAELKAQARQTEQATKESELLLGQLHLVQEALEQYFLQHQKAAQQLDFWHAHAPTEIWIDTRQPLHGQGWYEPEADGRWTGPETLTTIQLPPLPEGSYTLELHLVDAMQPEIVAGLNLSAVFANGMVKTVELVHEFGIDANNFYPMMSIGLLELPATKECWHLHLQLPHTVCPASLQKGSDDTRSLGMRIRGMRISVNSEQPLIQVTA